MKSFYKFKIQMLLIVLIACSLFAAAQTDTTKAVLNAAAQTDTTKPTISYTGYAEVYYSYDFSNPANHERPSFFYNFNRSNEVNLNLGFINASYAAKNVRANFGLMAGTWAQYNSSAEQPLLQHLWQ